MEDMSTEVWDFRRKKDEEYRQEIFKLFNELRNLAKSHIEYYENRKAPNSDRFHSAFTALYEHLQLGIENGVGKVLSIAHKYDFDPQLPANGYRSFVKIIHKCCIRLIQISRHISTNRGSVFFRSGHYSREITAYVITLGQLRACLYYLFKLLSYCGDGELLPDDEKLTSEQFTEAQALLKEVESLSQECFYGRCLGFQYAESMQKPLMTVCIFMASFSDGYLSENTSVLMKVANSMVGGSRYVMDPELRGQKIVEVTRNCDINFCQAFWAMNENDLMHTLPLFACPPVQLDKVITIPPETFELPMANGNSNARITPPCSHSGPGPVNCRLISYELREGHETWRSHGVSAKQTNASKVLPRASGLLIHLHGGGFVAQSSASHEVYLRHWAKELRVPIFCIDYSLAPKHPFPRAFEESFFAYCWALKNARALGCTGERICVVGDSAGANLAMAITMRATELNIRLPNGIQTTYGCQLVRYTPSPSRMMALMDPLLPLGIISRCLAAYAGMTEPIGINAHMGASITKQTLFDIDEEAAEVKDEEQQSNAQVERDEDLRIFQEQALRLQQQAKELLEETQKLRLRSSSLNIENSGNYGSRTSLNNSLSPSKESTSVSPTKGISSVSRGKAHDTQNLERVTDIDKAMSRNEEELATGVIENKTPINLDSNDSDKIHGSSSDTDLKHDDVEISGPLELDLSVKDTSQSSDNPTGDHDLAQDAQVCLSTNDSNSMQGQDSPCSAAGENQTPCDCQPKHENTQAVLNDAKDTKCLPETYSCACDVTTKQLIASPLGVLHETNQAVSAFDTNADNSIKDAIEINEITPKAKNVSVPYGHKITGSGDSGFHDFTPKQKEDRVISDTTASLPNLSTVFAKNANANNKENCVEVSGASNFPPERENLDSVRSSNADVGKTKERNQLRLNLSECVTLPKKSPSTPNLASHRLSGSHLLSPDSPADFFTPHGSMNSPQGLATPSYAKVRHIAQSPVEQLTQLPISRNPYMSPFLASDEMLTPFPPVYFVCCELDPMLDDSIQMAKRLRDLGNEVHLDVLADLPHGFLNFSLISREAKQGSELVVRRIKQILDTDDEGIFHMDDVMTADDFEIIDVK